MLITTRGMYGWQVYGKAEATYCWEGGGVLSGQPENRNQQCVPGGTSGGGRKLFKLQASRFVRLSLKLCPEVLKAEAGQ